MYAYALILLWCFIWLTQCYILSVLALLIVIVADVFFVVGVEVGFDFFVDFDINVPVVSFDVVGALSVVLVDFAVVAGGVEVGFEVFRFF